MKKLIRLTTVAAVVITLAQTLQAALITGSMGFSGLGVTINTSSAGTATEVTSWINPVVSGTSGTFAPPSPYALANNTPVTFAPVFWNFNMTSPITNFWSVGGFKFEMLSSQIASQGGIPGVSAFVVVQGSDVVSGNGFTPTAYGWSFVMSDPASGGGPPSWSFSASVFSNNSNGAPVVVSKKIGGTTVLSWNDPTFALQAAPAASGTYTNIPGATSPYTNTLTGSQRFFRLKQ
jgi:hypothetical protein